MGLPQPITIADSYAKVRRPELTRSINGLIAQFEEAMIQKIKELHENYELILIFITGDCLMTEEIADTQNQMMN